MGLDPVNAAFPVHCTIFPAARGFLSELLIFVPNGIAPTPENSLTSFGIFFFWWFRLLMVPAKYTPPLKWPSMAPDPIASQLFCYLEKGSKPASFEVFAGFFPSNGSR